MISCNPYILSVPKGTLQPLADLNAPEAHNPLSSRLTRRDVLHRAVDKQKGYSTNCLLLKNGCTYQHVLYLSQYP